MASLAPSAQACASLARAGGCRRRLRRRGRGTLLTRPLCGERAGSACLFARCSSRFLARAWRDVCGLRQDRPFEYLRLTSLGVIGALVKTDGAEVTNFLLQTEIIPLCLRIMEREGELSKTVATFIVQKLLMDDAGLAHICGTAERFYEVSSVLAKMVATLEQFPSSRLLKHVMRCYLRLSDNSRAREALRQCLPESLQVDPAVPGGPLARCLREDAITAKWLAQLHQNLTSR